MKVKLCFKHLRAVALGLSFCLIPLTGNGQTPDRLNQRLVDDQTIKEAKQAVEAQPGSADAHLHLGEAYLRATRYEDAIEPLKQAIQIKPDFERAHLALGTAYKQLNQYEEEILEYKNALSTIPNSVALHDKLSRALIQQRRLNEAFEIQKRLVDLSPEDARARGALGWISTTCAVMTRL